MDYFMNVIISTTFYIKLLVYNIQTYLIVYLLIKIQSFGNYLQTLPFL